MKPLISALVTTLGLSIGLLNAHGSKTLGVSEAERRAERAGLKQEAADRAAAEERVRRTTVTGRTTASFEEKKQARLAELYEEGRRLYEAGDIPGAHAVFEEMLLIDPGNPQALTYLENMKEQWERYLESKREHEDEIAEERKALELMQTPITIETLRATPLDQFLNNLSFASGVNFAIASGIEANVSNVKFIDTPLSDVLDAVLLPIGLKWRREDSVIIVEPALETRAFHFSKNDLLKIKTLYESETLQRVLWGADAQPDLVGESLVLDERAQALYATDSRQRLDKLAALLADLNQAIAPMLDTRIYKIQIDAGPKIRALIDAVINTAAPTPFDAERRVYIDGEDLIIRETPERLARIEALLRDEGFMQKLVSNELDIQAFSLIPREALEENREYLQAFANRVVEQVRTFLYTRGGVAQAELQGRRMWFDPNTLTLVITDTPENLGEVSAFIDSLPELAAEERFKVIYLRYQLADTLAGEILDIMGLAEQAEGVEGELEVTQSLRREQEFTWRDLTIVVRRIVAGGDLNDEFDDSAELVLRVAGTRQSTSVTLNELDVSQFVTDSLGGEYELFAEDVRPTGTSTSGEGRVRLTIRYTPPEEALIGP